MVNIERVYAPGSCNISKEEEGLRLTAGWIGTALTIAGGVAFAVLNVSRIWRLVLFIPATLAASGFLQAGFHFCANYGWRGVFNVANPLGQTEAIASDEFRRRDRAKAQAILGGSVLIGLAVAAISWFV